MKKKTRKALLRIASSVTCLSLVSALVCTQVQDTVSAVKANMVLSGSLTDVSDQYSIDGIRKEYFNDNVMQNQLSENDERWIIVGFEGNSLVDDYNESKSKLSFSE